MNKQAFGILILILSTLLVYLFATAPPPLPEGNASGGTPIPVEMLMRAVASENDVARALYTTEIVGKGMQVGLKFDENWREEGVEAGPLPALFLRETASSLEKNPVPLSLFLGSAYPINASNQFKGIQQTRFEAMLADEKPQFFFDEDIQRHTAMFVDKAVAEACVTCHNDHAQTPKSDWVLGEVMGATTWSYPGDSVNLETYLRVLGALRQGFRSAYQAYLDKAAGFTNPPEVGSRWPKDGNFLPDSNTFMDELVRQSSASSLQYGMEALSAQ